MRPSRTWTQLGRTFTQPWRLAQHRVISEYLLAKNGADTDDNGQHVANVFDAFGKHTDPSKLLRRASLSFYSGDPPS